MEHFPHIIHWNNNGSVKVRINCCGPALGSAFQGGIIDNNEDFGFQGSIPYFCLD